MKKLSLIVAVALGTLVACNMAMAQDASKKKGYSADQRLERMAKQLNLTDDQKPKVKAVLEDTEKKMKDMAPEDRRTKGRELRQEETKKLKGILTDEQFKKYEQAAQQGGKGERKSGEKKGKKKSE